MCRSDLARLVLDWTAWTRQPLVVGNGFIAREVMAAGDGDHVMYLLAGMGLAPSVAAGIARASSRPAVALEGDGNHLMGLSSTATIGLAGVPLTHIVQWNGGWESTGGQRLVPPGAVYDVGAVFPYEWSGVVRDEADLLVALGRAEMTAGACLIHVVGEMGEPPAPRTDLDMPRNARRLRQWMSQSTMRSQA
jgi:hypothetical protein